jgi:multidrug resistance efflux pump
LDRAKKGPTAEELAAAESAYTSAKSAYSSAVAAYNRAKNGPTKEELEILQSNLAKAQAALDQAQAAYDRIGGASNPFSAQTPQALQLQQATQDYQIALSNYNKAVKPDATTVAQALAAVAQAQAQVDQAESTLQKLKDSPNKEDIAQAQAQVDSAKAQLDLKKKGARAEDIRVAEIRVDQAKTGVEQAKSQLAKATLLAPMDGTITEILVREGELAAAGQPLFTIADLSNLKIETTDLDEFGAAKVRIDQPARIRVNAFTDKTLSGKVVDIADQSVLLASGDVSYPVTILLDSQDPELRWGMTVKVEFQ